MRAEWSLVYRRSLSVLPHYPGEAIATTIDRLDTLWLLTVVIDGVAGFLNAADQGFVTDISLRPQMLEQLVLRDDPVTVLHEVGEHLKHVRFNVNTRVFIVKLIELLIKRI